ncbi:hypothetical protein DXG01_000152 [Tephrocybe rancida]|nr:hypothetical protein DXG01_000152 [Tephrocybe rancida]
MATSMAAALAASLPAPSATPVPAAPTYEAIPASMSKVIDIEAEIPLTNVQLDGMVVTKILKHAREAPSTTAHGLLLGLDLDGTLEISNSFPLPHHGADEDDRSSKSVARYQASMLRSLKEVQSDDSVVGFYQATTLGAFFNQTLVDTQAIHQDKLRHANGCTSLDLSQTARGNASFRAFRLTTAFLNAHKKSNFSSTSLINHSLTFSSILEEVPLKIRTNPLLSSFLDTLAQPDETVRENDGELKTGSALPLSFGTLDFGTAGLTRNLEQIVEAVDNYRTEEGNLAYMSRHIARERAKADNYVAKRKEENATRVAQGLAPLPEEDVSRLFKIPAEPSRLDSMLLLGQIDAYGKSLEGSASSGLVKMYAAKAGALSTPHGHRGVAAHRALAHRAVPPTIRRRADGKRCKVRSSSILAVSSTPKAVPADPTTHVVAVKPTTQAEPTTTKAAAATPKAEPTTPKAEPTTPKAEPTPPKAEPTTTKAEPTTTEAEPTTTKKAEPTTTKAEPTTTQAPTTKATTKAPAPTAASNAPSFMVGTQTGQGTFYTTGLGACGITNTDGDYIAAVSHSLFDNYPGYDGVNPNKNPMCGRKVLVTYGGATVTVALTDRCTGCATTDLDFSPAAFLKLAAFDVGRIPTIHWVWL